MVGPTKNDEVDYDDDVDDAVIDITSAAFPSDSLQNRDPPSMRR